MPATASAMRQRRARPTPAGPPIPCGSLEALSPAMSEWEELVGSPTPDEAAVLVTAKWLGPIVDFCEYTPPGRLGRDIAKTFIGMG